jgi:hypothetical protein
MTLDQAVEKLKEQYETASDGEQVLQIHLFGIKFADELADLSLQDIAEQATGHRSYGTEIRKGIRLSRYVSFIG